MSFELQYFLYPFSVVFKWCYEFNGDLSKWDISGITGTSGLRECKCHSLSLFSVSVVVAVVFVVLFLLCCCCCVVVVVVVVVHHTHEILFKYKLIFQFYRFQNTFGTQVFITPIVSLAKHSLTSHGKPAIQPCILVQICTRYLYEAAHADLHFFLDSHTMDSQPSLARPNLLLVAQPNPRAHRVLIVLTTATNAAQLPRVTISTAAAPPFQRRIVLLESH